MLIPEEKEDNSSTATKSSTSYKTIKKGVSLKVSDSSNERNDKIKKQENSLFKLESITKEEEKYSQSPSKSIKNEQIESYPLDLDLINKAKKYFNGERTKLLESFYINNNPLLEYKPDQNPLKFNNDKNKEIQSKEDNNTSWETKFEFILRILFTSWH